MQLSIIGQERTAELLAAARLRRARRRLRASSSSTSLFEAEREQIERVEELSDAYHLHLDGTDVMVAYLLEVRRLTPGIG